MYERKTLFANHSSIVGGSRLTLTHVLVTELLDHCTEREAGSTAIELNPHCNLLHCKMQVQLVSMSCEIKRHICTQKTYLTHVAYAMEIVVMPTEMFTTLQV